MVSFIQEAVLKLGRFCVFCGLPPQEKTREHIIPRWLLALTGDLKRTVNFGFSVEEDGPKHKILPADQIQFPACAACNHRYSQLEDLASQHLKGLIQGEELQAESWDKFLDWIDKVRVGIWLGIKILQKGSPQIPPQFHLDQRIGRKDRTLLMYRMRRPRPFKGLRIYGIDPFQFIYQSSYIGIEIHDLFFLSLSADLLNASRLGFPFPRLSLYSGEVGILDNFDCFDTIKVPVIRWAFIPPNLELHQVGLLFGDPASEGMSRYREMVQSSECRSRVLNDGKSLVHFARDGQVRTARPTETIPEYKPAHPKHRHWLEIPRQVWAYRDAQLENERFVCLDGEPKELHHTFHAYNRFILANIDKEIAAERKKPSRTRRR